MLTKPILPPRAGYTERVRADGTHYYEPTAQTLTKICENEQYQSVQSDTDALLLDYEYRITMLELGVTDNGE